MHLKPLCFKYRLMHISSGWSPFFLYKFVPGILVAFKHMLYIKYVGFCYRNTKQMRPSIDRGSASCSEVLALMEDFTTPIAVGQTTQQGSAPFASLEPALLWWSSRTRRKEQGAFTASEQAKQLSKHRQTFTLCTQLDLGSGAGLCSSLSTVACGLLSCPGLLVETTVQTMKYQIVARWALENLTAMEIIQQKHWRGSFLTPH